MDTTKQLSLWPLLRPPTPTGPLFLHPSTNLYSILRRYDSTLPPKPIKEEENKLPHTGEPGDHLYDRISIVGGYDGENAYDNIKPANPLYDQPETSSGLKLKIETSPDYDDIKQVCNKKGYPSSGVINSLEENFHITSNSAYGYPTPCTSN